MIRQSTFYPLFICGLVLTLLLAVGCQTPCSSLQPLNAKISTYRPGVKREQHSHNQVVLVGGCFDVFHYGHLTFLRAAKKLGDYLVVALESDESIRTYKKRNPFHGVQQRAEILASLDFVNEVLVLPPMKGDKDYIQLVKDIRPKVIAVTVGDPQFFNKQKQAELVGGQVKIVTSLLPGLSTTCIRRGTCEKDFFIP
jgi:FAD synthetase